MVEMVVDGGMNGAEFLKGVHSSKPQHGPLSSSELLVGVLGAPLSDVCGTACSAAVANADEPQIQSCAAEPVPLFQLVAGGNPPRRDDVRQISAVATER